MAAFQVTCPACSGSVLVDSAFSGQAVSCPHCRAQFLIPAAPSPSTDVIPPLVTSTRYSSHDSRYGVSHRPTTTFGHAFGLSFGCVLGVVAVGFVVLALFCAGIVLLAGLGKAIEETPTHTRQR